MAGYRGGVRVIVLMVALALLLPAALAGPQRAVARGHAAAVQRRSMPIAQTQRSHLVRVLINCSPLFRNHFPGLPAGRQFPCFRFDRQVTAGHAYSAYYPRAWGAHPSALRVARLEGILEAAGAAAAKYDPLGAMPGASLVVATSGRAADYAHAFVEDPHPCGIQIYPRALSLPLDRLKFVVARELFKCFQFRSLAPQLRAPESVRAWWVEGSAEYFADTVYPDLITWSERAIPTLDALSNTTSLLHMNYGNPDAGYPDFVLFHYLNRNAGGDAGIITMLHGLPTTGTSIDQADALNAMHDLHDTFQGFAQDYLDNALQSQDGRHIMVSPTLGDVFSLGSTRSVQLDSGGPLVLRRYHFQFQSGHSYQITTVGTGAAGENQAEQAGTLHWDDTPDSIGCDEPRDYKVALTSLAGTESDPYTVRMSISAGSCDTPTVTPSATEEPTTMPTPTENCLVGTWNVTDISASAQSAVDALAPNSGIHYLGSTGAATYTFTADGGLHIVVANFTENASITVGGSSLPATVTLNGSSTTHWSVANQRLHVTGGGSGITVSATVAGTQVLTNDPQPFGFPLTGAGDYGYTCSATTLRLQVRNPVNSAQFNPVILTKVGG